MAEEHGQVRDEQLDEEHEARRRIAVAQIRQWPDPALRMRANEVEIFDEELRTLAERMIDLMIEANGVGLAANQVGVLRRLFVFRAGKEETPYVAINPRVLESSGERVSDDE